MIELQWLKSYYVCVRSVNSVKYIVTPYKTSCCMYWTNVAIIAYCMHVFEAQEFF